MKPAFFWATRWWWAIWLSGPSTAGHWRGPYKLTTSEADSWEVDIRESFMAVAVEVQRFRWTGTEWVRG